MNSTGAHRFVVASVRFLLFVGLFSGARYCLAVDCPQNLAASEKVARFKQLDTDAEGAMHARRFADAVQLYEQAVCLVPDSARGVYGLGMALAAAGEFRQALDSLKLADRLQPTTPMPLIMQVRVNFSLQDLDALKANLRETAVRFPNDSQAHQTLARFLAENNLLILSLAEALRTEQARGGVPSSRLQLAILENTVGAYDDAIRNASEVEQNPGLPNEIRASAAGVVGLSHESLGKTEDAVRLLKQSIALDPSSENSYLALADLFDQAKKYGDAVSVLKQARASKLESPSVLLALGSDLIRAEQFAEGTQILHDLSRRFPETDEIYISLADAGRRMGDSAREIEALQNLERRRPTYPMVHLLLARAILNAASPDYSKALNELAQAEKQTNEDPDVFYLTGKAYLALGQYEKALTPLQRSIELRPMEPSPYYQLAKAYQKLGKIDLARQQFKEVKNLEKVSPKP